MSLRSLIAIMFVTFFATGCQEYYNKGYEDGKKNAPKEIMEDARKEVRDAIKKGYQQGFNEGFKKLYPGTPIIKNELYASIYDYIVLGGILKIIITLLLVNILVIFHDASWQKVVGKIFFSNLGIGAAIFAVAIVPETNMVLNVLFMEMFENRLLQITIAGFSAVIGYFFVKFFIEFVQKNHTPVMLGWCALVLSAILAFLIPFFLIYTSAPEISSYSSSLIFCGMLIGAIYFFGDSLLRGKFD